MSEARSLREQIETQLANVVGVRRISVRLGRPPRVRIEVFPDADLNVVQMAVPEGSMLPVEIVTVRDGSIRADAAS